MRHRASLSGYTIRPQNTSRHRYRASLNSPTYHSALLTVPSFTREVNPRLAKRPFGHFANRLLTSLVKEATEDCIF